MHLDLQRLLQVFSEIYLKLLKWSSMYEYVIVHWIGNA